MWVEYSQDLVMTGGRDDNEYDYIDATSDFHKRGQLFPADA